MPNLGLDFIRLVDRVGNFFTKKLPISPPQPVHRHVHSADTDSTAGGDLRPWSAPLLAGQSFLEKVEKIAFAASGIFLAQTVHRLIQDGKGPMAFKGALRRGSGDEFSLVSRLDWLSVKRDGEAPAAALLALLPTPFVDEKMLEHRQEKRTKPPFVGRNCRQPISFKKSSEKFLREVLSLLRAMSIATDESV